MPDDPGSETERQSAMGDDAEVEAARHGRIGYGRYGRHTPLALALLLVGSLLLIGLAQRGGGADAPQPSRLVGRAAPAATLALLDGGTLRLDELRGSVVVLNFWASWCQPCRAEAPALQALHAAAVRDGRPAVVVGVGLKNDGAEPARAFAAEYGLTYPIGRDTGGDDPIRGPIERAYGLVVAPATVFINPDGVVASVRFGEISAAQLAAGVAEAEGV